MASNDKNLDGEVFDSWEDLDETDVSPYYHPQYAHATHVTNSIVFSDLYPQISSPNFYFYHFNIRI